MLSTNALRASSLIGAVICLVGVMSIVALVVGWQPLSDAPFFVVGMVIVVLLVGIAVTAISAVALGRRQRES
jgi:DMSO/TMAO reductase YedYZ heme-binding membrane subunit